MSQQVSEQAKLRAEKEEISRKIKQVKRSARHIKRSLRGKNTKIHRGMPPSSMLHRKQEKPIKRHGHHRRHRGADNAKSEARQAETQQQVKSMTFLQKMEKGMQKAQNFMGKLFGRKGW